MTLRLHEESAETPQSVCPICGQKLDRITHVTQFGRWVMDPSEATPGGLMVCGRCGCMLKFSEKLQPEALSVGDFMTLSDDERQLLVALRNALVSIPRELGGLN